MSNEWSQINLLDSRMVADVRRDWIVERNRAYATAAFRVPSLSGSAAIVWALAGRVTPEEVAQQLTDSIPNEVDVIDLVTDSGLWGWVLTVHLGGERPETIDYRHLPLRDAEFLVSASAPDSDWARFTPVIDRHFASVAVHE